MSSEAQEWQQRYDDLCGMVLRRASLIYGQAGGGNSERATEMTADLLQAVQTARQQARMQQEQTGADRYDLAALSVNSEVPSNSETGWEKED